MSDTVMDLPMVDGIEPVPTTTTQQAGRTPTARSVYVETYGCQMNVADSETVNSILGGAGFRLVDVPEDADIILINTCAVRENAEERVIGRASQLNGLRKQRPNLTLGILGCMAQHLATTLPTKTLRIYEISERNKHEDVDACRQIKVPANKKTSLDRGD